MTRSLRQSTLASVVLALLVGCAGDVPPAPGAAGVTEGFLGIAVADEPQAALIGRDILTAGGTAADAAVAMYFALAVTMPATAGLGGGGVCIAYDRATDVVDVVDFLPRAPSAIPDGADRPTAVPGNPRGFYALHGRWGRLHWSQLLAPAENMARFGAPVSRAFAAEAAPVADALAFEPGVQRIFAPSGGGVREGETVLQTDLASVIARIRTAGPQAFYTGSVAAQLVDGAAAVGGSLAAADLAAYQPQWRRPLAVGFGDRRAYFPAPPPDGGRIAGQTWAILVKGDRFVDASPAERGAVLAAAAERAFADLAGGPAADSQALVSAAYVDGLIGAGAVPPRVTRFDNPAAATVVAVDTAGMAVACSVTLNSLFGTGRIAPGTGVVLASLAGPGGRGPAMLGPMLVVRPSGRQFVFAGAATGGVAAPTALVEVAANTLLARRPLDEAVSAPRIHAGSDPNVVYAEPATSAAALQAIVESGRSVVTTQALGRVNAIVCPDGLPDSPDGCVGASDPRGLGLAASTR